MIFLKIIVCASDWSSRLSLNCEWQSISNFLLSRNRKELGKTELELLAKLVRDERIVL